MPSSTKATLDTGLVRQEFPHHDAIYLNSGSCGRKPQSVLKAIQDGWNKLNVNPTLTTFLDPQPRDEARQAAARMFAVDENCLLLTHNTSDGLQLMMQSFLLSPGDELVTTDQEHGSAKTIWRYLSETRGIVVREHKVDTFAGSERLCRGLMNLVNEKTKLVLVSEIGCLTGWRPDLSLLVTSLKGRVPVLVDGAHAPGQGPCRPSQYELWVGSGHKWLCAPNGTGFAYVAPHLIPRLKPLLLGDKFYTYEDTQLQRFEAQGTSDVVRLWGLSAACNLHLSLGPEKIAARQAELTGYLRKRLKNLPPPTIRTPDISSEASGMITFTWPSDQVTVPDLREALWERHRIWIQPDFFFGNPGHGMRVACHMYTTEQDIDLLIEALAKLVRNA